MRTKVVAGIIVTLFLMTTVLTAIPVKAATEVIKVGIFGPIGLPHWSPAGMKEAAEMARDEINALDGIHFPDRNATIQLVLGNEYALPVPDPDSAKAEIRRMIYVEGCDIIYGGFRTEVTTAAIEECMDACAAGQLLAYVINGASTTELISQTVPIDPTRYAHLFRINPTNSTALVGTIFQFLQYQAKCKLSNMYENPSYANKIPYAVLTEDLAWTAEMHILLTNPALYTQSKYLGPYFNCTYAARVPETATDIAPYLNNVQAKNAKILIHIFSGRAGLPLIIQWRELGIEAIPIGINVLAQIEDHWSNTLAKCEYEATLAFGGTRSPITPQATVFWDNFVAKTGKWPIYTAWGSYDGLWGLKDFVENTGISWADFNTPDTFAAQFANSPERVGLSGKFKFDSTHDVYSPQVAMVPYVPTDYVRARLVQWQKDPANPGEGVMRVTSPTVVDYAQKWKQPGWLYPAGFESLAESDTCAPSAPAYNYTVDGTVDLFDIQWIINAWLKKPGESGWNFNADLNDDDFINVVDGVRVAKDFLKSVTYPL